MKDNKTILKLYDTYINDIYDMTPENLEISKKVVEFENLLLPTLTKEQKELLNKISDFENDRTDVLTKETFKFAYSLATNLIVESLKDFNDLPNKKNLHIT